MRWLDRLLRRPALPEGVVLEPEEHVVAVADVVDGGQVVATSRGLWLPDAQRLPWHLISKATWEGGALRVTPARHRGAQPGRLLGEAVTLADGLPFRRHGVGLRGEGSLEPGLRGGGRRVECGEIGARQG